MKDQIFIKNCEYCSSQFEATNKDQKFCKPTCRVYNSQVNTGKRKPKKIEVPELPKVETIDKLKQDLKLEKQALEKAKSKYMEIIGLNIHGNINRINTKIENIESKVKYLNNKIYPSEKDKLLLEEQKNTLTSYRGKLYTLESKIDLVEGELTNTTKEIKKRSKNIFHLQVKVNDLLTNKLLNEKKGLRTGDIVSQLESFKNYYNFKEYIFPDLSGLYLGDLEFNVLRPLGKLPYPFSAFFYNWINYSINYSLMMIKELVENFDSKILFIEDHLLKDEFDLVTGIKDKKVAGKLYKNVTYQTLENFGQIQQVINDPSLSFDFIFICRYSFFNMNISQLNGLKKDHPKTSIICVDHKFNKNTAGHFDLIINFNYEDMDEKINDFILEKGNGSLNDFSQLNVLG